MQDFLQYILSGLSTGGIYALLAIGFVMIYKCSGVFNFAIGDLMVAGAFFCWFVEKQFNLSFGVGIVGAMILGLLLGMGIERFPLRPLIGRPILGPMLATLAIAIVLRGLVILFWGRGGWRSYSQVPTSHPITLGQVNLSLNHLSILIVCVLVALFLLLFFRFTKSGLCFVAVADNQLLARSVGLNISDSLKVSWIVAAMLAMAGGIGLGTIIGVDLNMSTLGLKAIPAAFVGGLDSIPGAVIGGMLIGVVEVLAMAYIGHGSDEIVAFIILVAVLLFRPQGLFGLVRIERI
jgi:branched-chain amino acid transport system permease protein